MRFSFALYTIATSFESNSLVTSGKQSPVLFSYRNCSGCQYFYKILGNLLRKHPVLSHPSRMSYLLTLRATLLRLGSLERHELLTIIIRYALILVSTLDPASHVVLANAPCDIAAAWLTAVSGAGQTLEKPLAGLFCSEPPVRFELTTYSLQVSCSTN